MRVGRDGEGSDEAEERWGLERLSFGFDFKQSKAWAGCDGSWVVILPWWVVFAVKMGYPILLVPNSAPPGSIPGTITMHRDKRC
jgi:hypothetical protein